MYREQGIEKGKLIEHNILILDAGSRGGQVVEFLNSLGCPDVIGVELLQCYVDYRKRRKINVIQGDLHNFEFEGNYYDIVHYRDVLEHMLTPDSCIRRVDESD